MKLLKAKLVKAGFKVVAEKIARAKIISPLPEGFPRTMRLSDTAKEDMGLEEKKEEKK